MTLIRTFSLTLLLLQLQPSLFVWAANIRGKELFSGVELSVQFDQPPKATVVVFLSSRCPCSHSHLSILRHLAGKFGGKGFQFVGIHSNTSEPPNRVREYFGKNSLPFVILEDQDARLADELGALKTPHVFVFSTDGKRLYHGGISDSAAYETSTRHYLEEALEALELKKPIEITQTRTFGCEIQR